VEGRSRGKIKKGLVSEKDVDFFIIPLLKEVLK
jgi:hypothetical protein